MEERRKGVRGFLCPSESLEILIGWMEFSSVMDWLKEGDYCLSTTLVFKSSFCVV